MNHLCNGSIGKLQVQIGNERRQCSAGEAIWVPCGAVHSASTVDEDVWLTWTLLDVRSDTASVRTRTLIDQMSQ